MDGRFRRIRIRPGMGTRTAKWDGDTLEVETIGFRDDLWLDANGNPLTNTGKMIERIRRPNYGTWK